MPGNNYYRLRQTDFDGKTEVFEIRVVKFDFALSKKVEIYPNPLVDEQLKLIFTNWEQGSYQLKISDMNGKMIKEILISLSSEGRIQKIVIGDLNFLSKGEYILTISGQGNQSSFKFIVK